uniref:CX domain-containing protein n=1 Tax=Ascaris lumbricoides TaxID=6252 RepID=A0A0M3IQL9_ASCLU
ASTTTVPPATAAGAEATGASGNESAQTTTPSPDQLLANIQFKDGSKPKTIVWGCKTGSEVCCGTECCPASSQPTGSANGSSRGSSFAGIAFGYVSFVCRKLIR